MSVARQTSPMPPVAMPALEPVAARRRRAAGGAAHLADHRLHDRLGDRRRRARCRRSRCGRRRRPRRAPRPRPSGRRPARTRRTRRTAAASGELCAVPVLPATLTPGICAVWPVPLSTTSTIICVSSPATDGRDRVAVQASGVVLSSTRQVGRTHLVDDVGPHHRAAVGDAGGDHRHLQRRGGDVELADRGQRGLRRVEVRAGSGSRPGR